jgi:hypothetical protein
MAEATDRPGTVIGQIVVVAEADDIEAAENEQEDDEK